MNLGRENEFLEFKETTGELLDATIDIAAILNKHERGTLYFGVKNNGEVVGFQIGISTERDISRKIFERIKPQIFPEITTDLENNIIKIEFHGLEKPYSAGGRYYIRVADESREMSTQELSRMILEVNYKNWEKQTSSDTLDDVDEASLINFYNLSIAAKRMPNISYDKKELIEKLKLVSDDKYHLNNAGSYLFSNNNPIKLKLAVFATNEKKTFVDISLVEGNIFKLIELAEKYVKKNINLNVDINGTEKLEIPIVALREIINNSFAHADYLGLSKNEIDIFPNRVAIYNPGAFPDGLNPESFVELNLASKIRNELICDILYKCDIIETWGTGFKKVYELCEKENVKIDYEKEQDGFWFIFYRNNETSFKTNESIELSELEQIILTEIRINPNATRETISQKYERSVRSIQMSLESLKEKRLIERIGSNKNGYWKINE